MHGEFLQIALDEARKNLGFSAPNPSVGAVLVKDGQVIARGYHRGPGKPHAEVEVLLGVSDADCQQSTLYVTLEPCCHFGRTGPCTDLILSRKVPRVLFAQLDPNPVVAGKGQSRLQEAGVICEHLPTEAIENFYKSYRKWWATGAPTLTGKLAVSLDGKIAGPEKQRVAITGETARQFTHTHRLHADAILTTAETILRDDPLFNVRLGEDEISRPVYVLDRLGRLPWTSKVIQTASKLVLFHGIEADECRLEALKELKVELVRTPSGIDGLNLNFVVSHLGKQGLHDIWLEAGAKIFSRFVHENLLDRAFLVFGTRWLGEKALDAFDDSVVQKIESAKSLAWSSLGRDGLLEVSWEK